MKLTGIYRAPRGERVEVICVRVGRTRRLGYWMRFALGEWQIAPRAWLRSMIRSGAWKLEKAA